MSRHSFSCHNSHVQKFCRLWQQVSSHEISSLHTAYLLEAPPLCVHDRLSMFGLEPSPRVDDDDDDDDEEDDDDDDDDDDDA